MNNTLDSILPELRSLLPASLRGAYLDGYLQRRRTPMELLLSRSLPNVDVAASTFEDALSEIRALDLPLRKKQQALAEMEQALAFGKDTRAVLDKYRSPELSSDCHVCTETGTKSCTACGTEIEHMGAHGEGCPRCAEQEMDVVDALAAQEEAIKAERANMPKMQRLRAMAASPPSDLSGWGQRITDLYNIRMRPVKKLFGSRGPTPAQQAEYDAEKKLWESLNRKARAEHKRLIADSNAGRTSRPAPPPKRPSLPDPVLTRRSEVAFRSEADALADIFNEGATWQAEATNPNMVGKWHAPGVRLSIFSEARGPGNVVAIATINDNDVDVEWLSAGLSEATRNEITRRLRTAALTQSEDSEAPSPLQDLIESTEKRALELGAKPARLRSPRDFLGDRNARTEPSDHLADEIRDLRDPTEIAESIKWLEDQDLGIGFDIDDRLSEMDSVSSLMEEIWTPILDTIGMEGVSTQNMRGRDRILSVATGAVFRDGAPFLLQRLVQQGRPTLRKVMIEIVEDSSDDDVTAFIDTEKVMTVGREQGSIGPMVHSSEQRGASFIGLLYQYMARLREDLERAPKVLSDVRRLLYWTGAMLDAPRCQDETKRRAMELFEAAKALYDEARTRVTTQSTTSSEIASIKTPLRKAAVSAAQLVTDCGEGQVDIFSVRPHLPLPGRQASRHEPPPLPPEGPQTPLREQDPHSVDVLERLVAALSEVFIVTPIRGGHGYRVVDLRSKSTDGVFTGLPRNTYLTTVSLWNSKKPDFLGEKAYLVQSFRDAGRSHDQYRALRRSMVETVERLSDEVQGGDSPAAASSPPPLTTRERYRREILGLGLSFDRENEAMLALDRALINGHDPEEVMRWARRPEPEEPQQSTRPTPSQPSQPADPAKIADRIRKLLALAERAGTPEEAGTAYATAQKLIAQHAISEEQIRQSRLGSSTRSNEPIVSRIIYTSPVPQMPTWIGVLGMCLSETNGCEMAQSHGPNREVVLKAWGRASDLEIVEELLRVIPGQVDALCNRSSFSGRTAKNNFRIGAVTVICERMRAAVREARRAIQEDTSEHSVTTTALALASLDNRGALAKAQMRRDVPNLRMKSTSHRGDAASFEAGRAAGASIGLSRQRSIK